ncbi:MULTISPECIES: TetR family transcriptional regulator C-terminal domain-containing protein [Alteromonadaceae]|uniref:TetR family transcriptional regulator C-terminal domain-containing protein n=1 Tax=Alteromonadaceae TaxID=72275 RepID=UPI0031050700
MTDNKINKEGRIGAANKQLILNAAEHEFAKHGFKGTRIQQVADRAQLPKTNVLYYFKSKENLYLAVLQQILELWNSVFDEATKDDDPAEVLARYIKDKMEFSLVRPEASRIFALEIINGAPNLYGFYKDQHAAWMKGRVEVIKHWMDEGKIQVSNAHYLLYHIWACCQHYADFAAQITHLEGKEMDRAEFENATKSIISLILKGCSLDIPEQYR